MWYGVTFVLSVWTAKPGNGGLRNVRCVEWEISEILVQFLASVQESDLLPRLLECPLITLMNQNRSAEHGFPYAVWCQFSKLAWNRYFSVGYWYHPLQVDDQQKPDSSSKIPVVGFFGVCWLRRCSVLCAVSERGKQSSGESVVPLGWGVSSNRQAM